MAGSMRWFPYTTDAGPVFGIFADESNVEAVNGAAASAGLGLVIFSIPGNLTPRYATYRNATGTITRRIPILTNAVVVPNTYTDPVSGELVALQSLSGETLRQVSSIDTGLIDGDNP